jgi:hypothetical protein
MQSWLRPLARGHSPFQNVLNAVTTIEYGLLIKPNKNEKEIDFTGLDTGNLLQTSRKNQHTHMYLRLCHQRTNAATTANQRLPVFLLVNC